MIQTKIQSKSNIGMDLQTMSFNRILVLSYSPVFLTIILL